jgi:hypothetical protein
MLSQMFAAFAVLAGLFCESQKPPVGSDAAPRQDLGAGADEELTTCTACRMEFMKCTAGGADLPPDARKERKRECADAAAKCFQHCTRGAVFAEYLVVVGVCAIVVAGAIASLGIHLLTGYGAARQVLIAPTP